MNVKKAVIWAIGIRLAIFCVCAGLLLVRRVVSDNIAARYYQEQKALLDAVRRNEPSVVNRLLASGMVAEAAMADGNGPLHIAVQISTSDSGFDITNMLLSAGADVRQINNDKETPLHQIRFIDQARRRVLAMSNLVKHGAQMNAQNSKNYTFLDQLVALRGTEQLELIMKSWGFMIDDAIIKASMSLAGAKAGQGLGFTDAYETLRDTLRLAQIHNGYINDTGLTPLMVAVLQGNSATIEQELKKGDTRKKISDDIWGYTVYHLGLVMRRTDLLEKICAAGPTEAINIPSKRGNKTPLLFAMILPFSQNERITFLDMLVKHGASLKVKDADGNTPLHLAVIRQDIAVVRHIMNQYKQLINPVARNNHGDRPIDIARALSNADLVALLPAG